MIVISKLTNSVYKDQRSFLNLNLNIPDGILTLYFKEDNSGWIEKTNGEREDISSLPDWVNDCILKYEKAIEDEENADKADPVTENKLKAIRMLSESDWAVLPDVDLANKNEWVAYRSALRVISKTPTENAVFPPKPSEVWS